MIGSNKSHLRRTTKKILRMVHQELIHGVGGSNQYGGGRVTTTPGTTCLLPGAGDCAGVTHHQGSLQAADIDAQFKRIGGNDKADAALAQALFDGTPLGRQVTGAIAANLPGGVVLPSSNCCLLEEFKQDLHTAARAGEDNLLEVFLEQVR